MAPAVAQSGVQVIPGSVLRLAVTADGTAPFDYRWRKDGVDLVEGGRFSGVRAATLVVSGVVSEDAGGYSVVVSNRAGSTIGGPALVFIGGSATTFFSTTQAYATSVPDGFDVQGYLARNPERKEAFAHDPLAAWLYYRDRGVFAGEIFDDSYRPKEYLALYPELNVRFGGNLQAGLLHWLDYGRHEGRLGRVPQNFDAAGYFRLNPDVALATGGDPLRGWQHYWNHGIHEGRTFDAGFRVAEYLALNSSLARIFGNDWKAAALHWLRYGRSEGRLGSVPEMFDAKRYLALYPDVAATWGTYSSTVFLHYWFYGVHEGRWFDDVFRVDDYLALNPDVAAAVDYDRREAFMHWVRYGQKEGRRARF